MDYVLLATVALLLLGGLVAIGAGYRSWNWGTIAAALLLIMSATGYLYLAARVAARERAWHKAITRFQTDIARVRHAEVHVPGRGVQPAENQQPIVSLEAERNRWSRALDRVRTWRGRSWSGASFVPPEGDGKEGTIELAAETYAENSPPIAEGAHVFVFDDAPLNEGGLYLGEFQVVGRSYDQATKRHSLKVTQTTPRGPSDTKRLDRDHPAVTVFEDLPVDRWLAFHETTKARPAEGDADQSRQPAAKRPQEHVEEIHKQDNEVSRLVADFFETFGRHDEPVPEDQQEAIIAKTKAGEATPGTYWAVVRFTAPHSLPAAGADEAGREYEPGAEVELDLDTALELRDDLKKAEIVSIVERRPLADARARLHGALIAAAKADGGAEVRMLGYAGLTSSLQAEKKALDLSDANLTAALADLRKHRDQTQTGVGEMEQDLQSWQRDAAEATRLAAAFEREVGRTKEQLAGVEADIVARGRELTTLVTRITAEIDRVAPPPERR